MNAQDKSLTNNQYGSITQREKSLQTGNSKKSKSHHYIKKLIDTRGAGLASYRVPEAGENLSLDS